ncbi:mitochondrial ribosomal protein L18 isoform X1 [Calliopsis andreniformis]|uniref:mitochondrial ribosomal protein L18 isoform X1 n=1 Tax=Calliopsis andreniformis TaxID=337506 RepID=UPI003FCD3902
MFRFRNCVRLFCKRQLHSNAEIVSNCKEIRNRNPRNLERLRIARKPCGYSLEKPGYSYWQRLVVNPSQRYVTAQIEHFENGPILTVSTQEWGLKKQLYSTNDCSAYTNLGRVLAQRCLENGICEVYVNEEIIKDKVKLLVDELEKNGICLQESKRYKHPEPWDKNREEKPWETFE